MRITVEGDHYLIACSAADLNVVRSLPSRRFDGARNVWKAPFIRETHQAFRSLGVSVAHLPEPTASGYSVTVDKNSLVVKTPGSPTDTATCQRIPDYRGWNPKLNAWVCRPSKANVEFLVAALPTYAWSPEALAMMIEVLGQAAKTANLATQKAELKQADEVAVHDFKFKTTPYKHQATAFMLARDQKGYALFMEQGTGKSKVAADIAAYKYVRHEVDAWLIICPNSLKDVWAQDEIPTHLPDYVTRQTIVWRSGMGKAERDQLDAWLTSPASGTLRILIMNVEAFSHERAAVVAKKFVAKHRTMITVDESSRIKTHNAARTKTILKLRDAAVARTILSGTPVTQGPLDVYAQFKFLDEHILGYSSYYAFRNRYAIMGGFNGKQIVSYQNVDELQRTLDPYMYRVLRADCLDLPPKQYQKRPIQLTPEQRDLYERMRTEMAIELEGQQITTTMVITQMLRLQQITGGFVPVTGDDNTTIGALPIPGGNPKVDALLDIAEETCGKVIVWARFRSEIELISAHLRGAYGDGAVVEFHGGVTELGRSAARREFQDPASPVRFFIGQTETGGIGLTLTQAKTVVYFSNSFSLESRLQSEDRAHRIGQTGTVLYIDLVADKTLDAKVLTALRGKKNMASMITGDNFTDWI